STGPHDDCETRTSDQKTDPSPTTPPPAPRDHRTSGACRSARSKRRSEPTAVGSTSHSLQRQDQTLQHSRIEIPRHSQHATPAHHQLINPPFPPRPPHDRRLWHRRKAHRQQTRTLATLGRLT